MPLEESCRPGEITNSRQAQSRTTFRFQVAKVTHHASENGAEILPKILEKLQKPLAISPPPSKLCDKESVFDLPCLTTSTKAGLARKNLKQNSENFRQLRCLEISLAEVLES